MRTVITHFYNEEYLLPWWLEHHKKIFDFGILIDYASTDRSLEICKEICPHWQILQSPNEKFGYATNDKEVEFCERQLSGWRIALTLTEFLVGDVNKLMHNEPHDSQYSLPMIIFASYNPSGTLDYSKPLWEQCTTGLPYTHFEIAQMSRSLHNFNYMVYQPGRHFWPHTTEDAAIFKFSNCLIGKGMINRRLQIQHRVSDDDLKSGIADQHVYHKGGGLTYENLKLFYDEHITSAGIMDCTELIKKFTYHI